MRQLWWVVGASALVTLSACTCGGGSSVDAGSGGGAGGGAVTCFGGQVECNGACTSLQTDSLNCGACGTNCGIGRQCTAGVCERTCSGDEIDCSSVCVNIKTDVTNCGACGNACVTGQTCQDGGCVCTGAESLLCDGFCYDPRVDERHCGACGNACDGGFNCENSSCQILCTAPEIRCNATTCADLATNPQHCGACGRRCPSGATCGSSQCACGAGRSLCGTSPNWTCIDTRSDNANCGGCGLVCPPGQTCSNSVCETPCPSGSTRCSGTCVNTQVESFACGSCTNACTGTTYCDGGSCEVCNSATTDCDRDGWLLSEGDCCDTPGACPGQDPKLVNPGAVELAGNNFDENCNALIDALDTLDTQPCDGTLGSQSADAGAYAAALGLCRTTVETPATPQQRTWGVISAELIRVDGSPLTASEAASIRSAFGNSYVPFEGQRFVVLSSGIAADATQTNPGPNGGPAVSQSNMHGGFTGLPVNIQTCMDPRCIKDWFQTANPPLKAADRLPEAPNCTSTAGGDNQAWDSVMLRLRIRAPTNARAFTFKGLFLSVEYPEFVCQDYNDQFLALVKTPTGTPAPIPNPVDSNLMTYLAPNGKWPIGINIAKGTDLFRVCEAVGANMDCADSEVSATSCSEGLSKLAGTGFEVGPFGGCAEGGATKWLDTSGNVLPGQIVELRLAIWDVGDNLYDSTAILDSFKWLTTARQAGTD